MFEDLRKDGEDSPFFQPKDETDPLLDAPAKKRRNSGGGGGGGLRSNFFDRKIFGLTPFQRFAISLVLFILVFIAGFALLLANGSVVILS